MLNCEKLEVLGPFVNLDSMLEKLVELLDGCGAVEELLGIEFAMKDGTYLSDLEDDYEGDENDIDITVFRVRDQKGIGLPKTYPAHLFAFRVSYSAGSTSMYARWADDLQEVEELS
jgi:hypothetical protein